MKDVAPRIHRVKGSPREAGLARHASLDRQTLRTGAWRPVEWPWGGGKRGPLAAGSGRSGQVRRESGDEGQQW